MHLPFFLILHLCITLKLTEVVGILGWKFEGDGDGLIDLASLLITFKDPGNCKLVVLSQILYPGECYTTSFKKKASLKVE